MEPGDCSNTLPDYYHHQQKQHISTLNTELDKFIAIQADNDDTIDRALHLADDDTVSMELPLVASRKGTVLGFNASTGAAEVGPTIANVNSLCNYS